ncbi:MULTISPECIES: YhgE/Pip domain-containing protein [unclassified Clostridium]|uniref:YhgE/Pip domain-containing protein n=1 Tax=unclassified Clostridium TaxID=2614128 RepID=UPI0032169F6A
MNFLKIAGKDIKSIFKNRFIRVSVIAIIIVPLLYSLLYLDAFWDPYARIQDMTIAVVNEDGGALLDGEQVNYGEDIVENLKGNEEVGWDFTSNEKANEGLEKQGYYAKFVIPEDFSESVVAAKEGKPQVADLQFVCNEKKNFLAAQINSQVEKLLKEEIVGTISNNYVTVAFDKLYEAKDGFIKAADGSEKLYNGIGELNEKVPMLAEGANKLGDGSAQLKDGQGALNSGIKSINNGLSEVNSKVPTLGLGVDKLYSGSQQVTNGLSEVNSKVPALGSGVDKLYDGSQQVTNGLSEANSKVSNLSPGVNKLYDGSGALTGGSKSLYSAFNTRIYPNVNLLKDGANKLNGKLKDGESRVKKLKEGGEKLKTASDDVAASSTAINKGYQESVKGGVDKLISGVNKSSEKMKDISEDIITAVNSNPEVAKDPNIQAALVNIQALNKETSETPKQIQELQAGTKKFGDNLGEFNGSVNEYTGKVNGFATGTVALTDSVNDMGVAVNKISGGLNSLEAGLNENTKDSFGYGLKSVSDNMAALNSGLGELKSNIPALSGGIQALYNGSSEIYGGLGQLRSEVPTLSGGIQALYNGSSEIYGGLGQLRSNIPALSGGIQALYNGSNQLVDGSNALVDGQNQLNNGVSELTGKVPQLEDGVDKLYKGSNELATALKDGAGEMKSGLKNSSEEMGDFVSAPINMKNEPINKVPNYGTGFAPYFISLSLWIGAIMMFFVISAKTDDDANLSKFDKVIGKYLSFGFIGLLQALLVSAVVMGLGLTPTSTGMYFASIVFLSLVFIAIIQCLISLFGDAGRLLGIVLLILQLTACAGTFPLEIVPKFFKVINPYMPFTYSVELLREVISANTINYGIVGKDFLILGIVLLVFLTISIVFKNAGENLQNIIEGRKGKSVENIKEQSM